MSYSCKYEKKIIENEWFYKSESRKLTSLKAAIVVWKCRIQLAVLTVDRSESPSGHNKTKPVFSTASCCCVSGVVCKTAQSSLPLFLQNSVFLSLFLLFQNNRKEKLSTAHYFLSQTFYSFTYTHCSTTQWTKIISRLWCLWDTRSVSHIMLPLSNSCSVSNTGELS